MIYDKGVLVMEQGDMTRRAIAFALRTHMREHDALVKLQPLMANYVQDRLYRYPDGLRFASLKAQFETLVRCE